MLFSAFIFSLFTDSKRNTGMLLLYKETWNIQKTTLSKSLTCSWLPIASAYYMVTLSTIACACICFHVKIIIQVHGSGDTNTSKNSSKSKSKGNHNYKGAWNISQSLIGVLTLLL